jgi:hypothetical protein
LILGFAHLAINVPDLLEAESVWGEEGYVRKAIYLDVPNHPSKHKFLPNYQPSHDLMLLAGLGLWPLELTCHGIPHSINTLLEWRREFVQITVPDPTTLQRLLVEGLGFRMEEDETLILENRLPNWVCRLRLQVGITTPVSLGAVGPTCLAFYCNRIDEDVQHLLDLGATEATEHFDISLGARNMTIVMLRAPGGLLLELINPRNKT